MNSGPIEVMPFFNERSLRGKWNILYMFCQTCLKAEEIYTGRYIQVDGPAEIHIFTFTRQPQSI